MHHQKLVQHMKVNADRMSQGLMQMIRDSDRCRQLMLNLTEPEHKQYTLDIYLDLTEWLANEKDAIVEEHYVALGKRRAQQSIPLSELFWAVSVARDYLWRYVQQECLLEEPVAFWGGVTLLQLINKFFDRAVYYVILGYQAGQNK
jgi:hypothetical protein